METAESPAEIETSVAIAISLAKALNHYVGAADSSNDAIVAVADDIFCTFQRINDLNAVLKQGQDRNSLTADALANANQYLTQSQALLQNLLHFLVVDGKHDGSEVRSGQIDITKFRDPHWLVYRSDIELYRLELQCLKADVSMLYLSHMAVSASSTSAQRQATDQMEFVYNKRTILARSLKQARQRKEAPQPSKYGISRTNMLSGVEALRNTEGLKGNPEQLEGLYNLFDYWLALRQDANASPVGKNTVMRGEIDDSGNASQEQVPNTRSQHGHSHGRPLAHRGQSSHERDPMIPGAMLETRASTVPVTRDTNKKPSYTSVREKNRSSRKERWFRRSRQNTRASDLQVPAEQGVHNTLSTQGVMEHKAFFFQRVSLAPGRYEIVDLETHVPSYLCQTSSTASLEHDQNVSSVLQNFAILPDDYRYHVTQTIQSMQHETEVTWILLHVEAMRGSAPKMVQFRRRQDDVVGVHIILKKGAIRPSYTPSTSATISTPPALPVIREVHPRVPRTPLTVSPSASSAAFQREVRESPAHTALWEERSRSIPTLVTPSNNGLVPGDIPNELQKERGRSPRRVGFADTDETIDGPDIGTNHSSEKLNTAPGTTGKRSQTMLDRDRVLPETLDYFGIPWLIEGSDPNKIVAFEHLEPHQRDQLYDHTEDLLEFNRAAPSTDLARRNRPSTHIPTRRSQTPFRRYYSSDETSGSSSPVIIRPSSQVSGHYKIRPTSPSATEQSDDFYRSRRHGPSPRNSMRHDYHQPSTRTDGYVNPSPWMMSPKSTYSTSSRGGFHHEPTALAEHSYRGFRSISTLSLSAGHMHHRRDSSPAYAYSDAGASVLSNGLQGHVEYIDNSSTAGDAVQKVIEEWTEGRASTANVAKETKSLDDKSDSNGSKPVRSTVNFEETVTANGEGDRVESTDRNGS